MTHNCVWIAFDFLSLVAVVGPGSGVANFGQSPAPIHFPFVSLQRRLIRMIVFSFMAPFHFGLVLRIVSSLKYNIFNSSIAIAIKIVISVLVSSFNATFYYQAAIK